MLETQNSPLFKITNNLDNNFIVVDIKTYHDDLFKYSDLLSDYCLLNDDGSPKTFIKILILQHDTIKTDCIFYAILKGFWEDTYIEINDNVHVFGKINHSNLSILLDDKFDVKDNFFFNTNFMIVEPSFLVYPTALTASFPCYRRPIFQMNFLGRDADTSITMMKG